MRRDEELLAFLSSSAPAPRAVEPAPVPTSAARHVRALAQTLLADLRAVADEIGQVAATVQLSERAELAADADRLAAWRIALNDLLIAFAADLAEPDRPGVPRKIWEGRDG